MQELWKYGAIQFGYVCFFLITYPPVAMIVVIMNVVHVELIYRSFTTVIKRKDSVERSSIGVWNHIFLAISFLALIFNIGILVFSSNGVKEFIAGKLQKELDSYALVVVLVIVEHIGFVLKFIISAIIRGSPTWVARHQAARNMRKMMNHLKLRKKYAQRKIKSNKAKVQTEATEQLETHGHCSTGRNAIEEGNGKHVSIEAQMKSNDQCGVIKEEKSDLNKGDVHELLGNALYYYSDEQSPNSTDKSSTNNNSCTSSIRE